MLISKLKSVYVTIDDGPSKHTYKKVDFLVKHKIFALFYMRGEHIEKYSDQVVYAIKKGFLIGNHSYSHPYFSTLSFTECCQEVLKTEELIDSCYRQAGVIRPALIIRFPFGDRGGVHEQNLQQFLKAKNFSSVLFGRLEDNNYIDALWDWDTLDYKKSMINDKDYYVNMLTKFYTAYSHKSAILLLHDFDSNHHLFEITMDFLIAQKITFSFC